MGNKITPAAIRGRRNEAGRCTLRLEPHTGPYSNALTSVQMDNVIVSHCIEASYFHGVTIRRGTNTPRRQLVTQDSRIRRLTPRECWRLMGFDDTDFDRAKGRLNERLYNGRDRSDSQLYKQAGNSIVVDVLEAILSSLRCAMPYLFEDMTVGSFFSGIGAFEKALERLEDAA